MQESESRKGKGKKDDASSSAVGEEAWHPDETSVRAGLCSFAVKVRHLLRNVIIETERSLFSLML